MTMIDNISVVILCRNENYELGKCIIQNSLLKFLHTSNIIVIDSSTDSNYKIEKQICDELSIKFIHKKIGDKNIEGMADLRNFGSYNCPTDWVLHIDIDELFSTKLFENIHTLINDNKNDNKDVCAYRFPRINLPFYEQYPDYQTRLINKKKCVWSGNVHEIIEAEKPYILTEYPIIHKDIGSDNKINKNIRWSDTKKNVLVCSLFKDSEKYLNRFFDCLVDNMTYINNINNTSKNKIYIELCFIEGNSKDNTWNMLIEYHKKLKNDVGICFLEKYNLNDSLNRFDKLAISRNMLIKTGLQNKRDYVLMIDSDVIFEKDLIIKLIDSLEKNKADVVAPLITIEKFRTYDNDYFYDTLASIDNKGKNLDHCFPYIVDDDKNDNRTNIKKMITKCPIDMKSVGTCYIAKSDIFNINDFQNFSIVKCYNEIKKKDLYTYDGQKSEQVRLFEKLTEGNKDIKIILDPTIRILHTNLERIGMKWH